jgi:hypothetical protein
MDAGRIDEDDLCVRVVPHSQNPVSRRLRLVGNDGNLRSDQTVQERGFPCVWTPDERDVTLFHRTITTSTTEISEAHAEPMAIGSWRRPTMEAAPVGVHDVLGR